MKELQVITIERSKTTRNNSRRRKNVPTWKRKLRRTRRFLKALIRALGQVINFPKLGFNVIILACIVSTLVALWPSKQSTKAGCEIIVVEEESQTESDEFEEEQIVVLAEPSVVSAESTTQVVEVIEPQPILSAYGPGEVYYYYITNEEKILIAKVVWKEARGESFRGQVAVAATVFNRLMSNDSAINNDSIYSIVTQPGAYASIKDVTYEEAITCLEAVEHAAKGYDPTREVFENGARFFYAPEWTGPDQLAKREGVTKMVIGNHTFHDKFAGEE